MEEFKNSQTNQAVESLNCKYCNKIYTSEWHLRSHMKKMHHPTNCLRCWKPFENAEEIPEHMKTHVGDLSPCICYVCGKVFNGLADLRTHLNVSNLVTYITQTLIFMQLG